LKLLLDQNLSRKLVSHLEERYPGTSHVLLLGKSTADDSDIWHYARLKEFTLVTKNTDMVDLCVLRGAPPRVIWLRMGNCTTDLVREILDRNERRIRRLDDPSSPIVLSLFRLSPVGE
jgi:predicted nuclease of predicted toxin-antitoxin system